ncbi:Sir2 family NAD-dependent protein deacetylase [Bacillus cereus]|uniref:Sir2 family NAD-dependent protein deacetylase n=1 Tax=Bacillus cereus TaxID=1396 RepID=UPI003012F408
MQQFEEVRSILEKAKKITVLTGAGASTESGIPDFRSANGLYADANVEMYLSRGYYNRSPKEFWKHYKEIFQINTFLVNEELTGQEYNFDFVFQNKIGEFVEGLSSMK